MPGLRIEDVPRGNYATQSIFWESPIHFFEEAASEFKGFLFIRLLYVVVRGIV
jgi:hypothetical protein